eukprot:SM000078S22106  [mRNA]  locus=s78:418815:427691:- [translate_table: standard]
MQAGAGSRVVGTWQRSEDVIVYKQGEMPELVVIEGFKSYKEQIATEPFSPKHNCVVGANGSGKTNFFHAIRFVLSDLFHNLRSEDRQALLHEGAGHQVLSAFVEIVFENSGNRIPVDRQEVCLRRTIGAKKDEYFLDKKHILKQEVMNLLESAGFSRSNPYYVVQQGKISSLTLMKDAERLDLLKEIGGTRVYEERRKESLRIMHDTEIRRKQIVDVVTYIEERLKELDEEKEELSKYQQLDKQRRSLEYTIFDKELSETRSKVEEVDEARARVSAKSADVDNTVREAHEKLKEIEKELKALQKAAHALEEENEHAELSRTQAIESSSSVELDVKDLQERLQLDQKAKAEMQTELDSLRQEIQSTTSELTGVCSQYEAARVEEERALTMISDIERQLSHHYRKEGRASQFSSKKERDKALEKEISELEGLVQAEQAQIHGLQSNFDQLSEALKTSSRIAGSQTAVLQSLEQEVARRTQSFQELRIERNSLQEQRKQLWKEESDLIKVLEEANDEVARANKAMDIAAPGDIRKGLIALKRICKDHHIMGVHGPLIELLDCEDKFNIPVEVTAGNSLFHIVVDTDEISHRIIKYMLAQKAGRLTFLPLNRMRTPSVKYPSDNNNVLPLLRRLKYAKDYESAFAHVFARTLICRDIDTATSVSKTSDLDCITMEGDQVTKKGAMTGGFHDHWRSKLKLVKVDQKITHILSEIQKVEAEKVEKQQEAEQVRNDMKAIRLEESTNKTFIAQKEKAISDAQKLVREYKELLSSKRDEVGTELTGGLSNAEQQEVASLNAQLQELKTVLVQNKTRRMEVETRKGALETVLASNLVKRQEELEKCLTQIDPAARADELALRENDAANALINVQETTRNQKRVKDELAKTLKLVQELKNSRDEIKSLEDAYEQSVQDERKELEQLVNRRSLLLQKKDDLTRKIRDLGSLPSDAFEKYQDKTLKELHKMLHKCNENLKIYGHVNKKALDQYMNFTDQREELRLRQAELDDGDDKIKELILVLDQRKDEAIERTFKGVAKHFREAFAELVQGGHGSLVMMKKRHADEDEDEDADEDGNRDGDGGGGRVEKYVGVKVKVSFTGQGETQSMKQLSGGQKTVVALALIFAIQRCDPAPFYLFDEIDAALDPQYRTAVGNMIRRQADKEMQFITTTFRPELVNVADKVYAVSHRNRVSRVDVVSREDALHFIDHEQNQQEA